MTRILDPTTLIFAYDLTLSYCIFLNLMFLRWQSVIFILNFASLQLVAQSCTVVLYSVSTINLVVPF